MNKRKILNGKYIKSKRLFALLVSLIVVFTAFVGTTIALLITKTEPVTNTFNPTEVKGVVEESFNGKTKENVGIKNTGDTKTYVRAAIIVSWKADKDNDGTYETVSAELPVENTDYKLVFPANFADYWIKGSDEFYYYKSPIATKDSTQQLISECVQLVEKNGYKLSVEIIAQGIQSTPTDAVKEAWGVTLDADGNITATAKQEEQ